MFLRIEGVRALTCLARVALIVLWSISSAVALGACLGGGTEGGNPLTSIEKVIGREGGDLDLLNGAKVVIPPNALNDDRLLRFEQLPMETVPDTHARFSNVYALSPYNVAFAQPITIEIPFEGDANLAAMFWSTEDDLEKATQVGSNVENNVVHAQVQMSGKGFVGTLKCRQDNTCLDPESAPQNLIASSDLVSGVHLSWAAPTHSNGLSAYEVSRDNGQTWESVGLQLEYMDVSAPKAPVQFSAPTVTSDDRRSLVRLELAQALTIGKTPDALYQVRALFGNVAGAPSLTSTGRRASGDANTLRVYWQRADADDDGRYADVPDAIGRVSADLTASEGTYFWRARVLSDWAQGTSPSAASSTTRFEQIAVGSAHVCAIRMGDNKVVCWGQNSDGQAPPGPSSDAFKQIDAAAIYTCGIRSADSNIVCWGATSGSPPQNIYKQVATGSAHTCGLQEDNKVICWGDNTYGAANSSPTSQLFKKVVVGQRHTCGILQSGQITCWGTLSEYATPLPTMTSETYSSIASKNRYVCGIREADNKVVCWGDNERGQAPATPSVDAYLEVSVSRAYSCGIRSQDRKVQCWGQNENNEAPPGPSANAYLQIASSNAIYATTCGLRLDRKIDCWGGNLYDQAPSQPLVDEYKQIASSDYMMCGIRSVDNTVVCWGQDSALMVARPSPYAVLPPAAYRQVVVGPRHVCAIRAADDHLVCWGYAGAPSADAFTAVASSELHACAIRKSDQKVICWGTNDQGQAPTAPSANTFQQVAVGPSHTCGIHSVTHKVICWGSNDLGEAPPGPSVDAYRTIAARVLQTCGIRESDKKIVCWGGGIQVPPSIAEEPYLSLAASSTHLCAIRAADHKVACWGSNSNGEAPLGPSIDAFKDITVGDGYSCGIRLADNKVICWGQNWYGQAPRP